MYRFRLLHLIIGLLILNSSLCADSITVQPNESFEEIDTNQYPSLELTSNRYIDGTQSLLWYWKRADSTLKFKTSIPYKKRHRVSGAPADSDSVFWLWIYNETPINKSKIRFEFGKGSKKCCYFDYGLNFKGWRLIAVKYDLMKGAPQADMDYVKIISPKGVRQGRLFFDAMQTVAIIDKRMVWQDYQFDSPYKADNRGTFGGINTLAINQQKQINENEEVQANKLQLEKKLIKAMNLRGYNPNQALQLEKYFKEEWKITKDKEGIRGKHLFTGVRAYLDRMLSLAKQAYQAKGADKQRLTDLYILASEYLLDQGWAEGSAQKNQFIFGYSSRSWGPAVLLMKDELKKHHLLKPIVKSMMWLGRDLLDYTLAYSDFSEEMQFNFQTRLADYVNITAMSQLYCSLLIEGYGELYMNQFTDIINQLILEENPFIKSDGSLYHHHMHYAGYGIPALIALAKVVNVLDGTPYEISQKAYDKIKMATLKMEWWGYPQFGFNACGRHPITGLINTSIFDTLAKSAPKTDQVDVDLMNAFLRMKGGSQEAIPSLQGFIAMNYNASGIYKYNNYSAIAKGYNKDVLSHETYGRDNRYGRYGSFGTLMINKEGSNPSGYKESGWDWSMPPGATTLQLLSNLDLLEGSKTAFYPPNPPQVTWSGAVDLNEKVGLFAFSTTGSSLKNKQSIDAQKSIFFVDGLMLCVGSNINNKNNDYNTVTSIIQHSVDDNQVLIKDEEWLIDPMGIHYYIPKHYTNLKTWKGSQESKHNKTREKTTGTFIKAWFDHGKHPQNQNYEYLISLKGKIKPQYEIISQNSKVHHVKIDDKQAWAFFEPSSSGVITKVNKPCLILLDKQQEVISLAVSDTYTNAQRAYNQEASTGIIEIKIKGKYEIVNSSQRAVFRDGKLIIEVVDGKSTQVKLKLLLKKNK